MGVVTRQMQLTSKVAPEKLFHVFVIDPDTHKTVPHHVESKDVIEGSGGPGSVVKMKFAEGSEIQHVKKKIDVVDKNNMVFNMTIIEAHPWMDEFEKACYETRCVPSSDGGSICKITAKYYPKGDKNIDLAKVTIAEDKIKAMFKDIEALQGN